jgi:hypothetical protein
LTTRRLANLHHPLLSPPPLVPSAMLQSNKHHQLSSLQARRTIHLDLVEMSSVLLHLT